MTQRMLSYCGLACDTCPIHRATLEPDATKRRSMRAAIAREINELYGMALRADDVGDCDGCRIGRGAVARRPDLGMRACGRRPRLLPVRVEREGDLFEPVHVLRQTLPEL